MQFTPHPYQSVAMQHARENTHCGLFLDMGLGKTVITLTTIAGLIYDELAVTRVLVVAPLRVARSVWTKEADKWDHLSHLKISRVMGTPKQRIAALAEKADIYVTNRENIEWLCAYYGGLSLPFDMLVIDELSSFKSPKAKRFKALKQVRGTFSRIIGLTGTPAPNGLMDLWAQLYIIDGGERLYKTITRYRETWFKPAAMNGAVVFKYSALPGAEDTIRQKIGDICISMKAEDFIDMPGVTHNYREIDLPQPVLDQYREFEREQILDFIDSEVELTAIHGAALINKLLQFSNGAVYYETGIPGKRDYKELHDEKIQELVEILEEANGKPVLVAYLFQHDRERILRDLAKFNPRELKTPQDELDWDAGKIQLLLTHPASAGHGLNLQYGGHIIVWFGETWSLELYEQFNARLLRQGQEHAVVIHHIICNDTEDARVVATLTSKGATQEKLLKGLAAKIEEYKALYRG